MNLLTNWIFWVVIYLISGVLFSQTFRRVNRNMKDAGLLTILLELFTSMFALLFILFFPIKFSINISTYLILFIVMIIYAFTDRLNIEARYGLETSTFSMLKQLSTVFIILFGVIILKEKIVLKKFIGITLILLGNVILSFKNGHFRVNKYFFMTILANFLFAIAMLINVNISNEFNIGIYTFMTVFFPSIFIFIAGSYKLKDVKEEFKLYDKKKFLFASLMWCTMLVASVKAYEFGNLVVVACLLALTSILNSIVELFVDRNYKSFLKKLFVAVLIIIGVLLVKI